MEEGKALGPESSKLITQSVFGFESPFPRPIAAFQALFFFLPSGKEIAEQHCRVGGGEGYFLEAEFTRSDF